MNHTTYGAGQSQRRDCLAMLVTCAWCPGEQRAYFSIPTGVDGHNLQAYRVNTYAGKPVRETVYRAGVDTTLHLFRSPYKEGSS